MELENMHKINKCVLLFSIALILLLSLSSVSAEDGSNACLSDSIDEDSAYVLEMSDGVASSDDCLDAILDDEVLCSGSSSL